MSCPKCDRGRGAGLCQECRLEEEDDFWRERAEKINDEVDLDEGDSEDD